MRVIEFDELRRLVVGALDLLEDCSDGSSVALSKDSYWDVSWEDRYRMDQAPEDLVVGSLSEDLDLLSESLEGGVPTTLVATWAGRLLEAVGEEISNS